MTQDRFSAQLRQHLLESANERPADGQLAAVVEAVGHTSQRTPLVARLTSNPGRIGGFPTAAIRYGLIAAALALAMVAGAIFAGAGGRDATTLFEGTWITIDPADGSGMTLVVGPGAAPEVYFEDGYASGAACVRDEVKRFTARGTGEISGNRLVAEFPDGGGCGLTTVAIGGLYDYNAATDSLVDQDGLGWSRALDEQPDAQTPETQAPATDGPPTEAPTPSDPATEPPLASPVAAKCFDIPAGEAYRQTIGEVPLTLTVPDGAQFAWQGYRDAFEVAELCLFGAPVRITASAMELVFASCGHAAGRPVDAAMAVKWLTETEGYTIAGSTELTIAGYPATRLDVSFESSDCPEGIQLWSGAEADRESSAILYVLDVEADGVPVGISILNRRNEGSPAQVAEAEAMVTSLQIEP